MKPPAPFQLFGIFGYPLAHTLSPDMHEAGFRALGIDANYIVLELDSAGFRDAMRYIKKSQLSGFNVTVPYKEVVLKFLDQISPEARAIGAVNTVYRKGNRWCGTNTDMEGFLITLSREGHFCPRNKKAVVLGAGGASRAVTYGLCLRGIRKLSVVDAVPGKAENIIRDFQKIFKGTECLPLRAGDPEIGSLIAQADLVVNATPLGLKKDDPLPVSAEWIPNARKKGKVLRGRTVLQKKDDPKLFMDLIYNPVETAFLAAAKKRGHRTLNGSSMLLYQGVRAFECWTRRKAPVSVMREALMEKIRLKGGA